MAAYYNEHDPHAAAWLRQLIIDGLIRSGDVDTRSIVEVDPADLDKYDECHFFAGIGGWQLALQLAGWPEGRRVWTGSCPCQPLSVAGQREGHADERHLWPAFHRLISECRPAIVFGEQVAGQDGREWFAAVRADLEADGYACGAADLAAAGVGAPHKRQRIFWVADSGRAGGWRNSGTVHRTQAEIERTGRVDGLVAHESEPDGDACGLADDDSSGRQPRRGDDAPARHGVPAAADCVACGVADSNDAERGEIGAEHERDRSDPEREAASGPGACGEVRGVADSDATGLEGHLRQSPDTQCATPERSRVAGGVGHADRNGGGQVGSVRGRAGTDPIGSAASNTTDARHGGWAVADWLGCRDGRWRPVEPGTFPLDHGISGRVGLLRGYGNAIVPQVAAEFVAAFLETEG